MAEGKGKLDELEIFAKNVFKGATVNSIFDPDMTEKKVQETPEFTAKQILNHYRGKEKLTQEQFEQLKRSAKYM